MKHRAVTYAHVYNRAYTNPRALDAWARDRIRRTRPLAHRLAWAKHLLTLSRTQHLGAQLSEHTKRLAYEAHRLAFLGAMARLRVLQRCILRYLWRPGGPLMRREMHLATAGPGP